VNNGDELWKRLCSNTEPVLNDDDNVDAKCHACDDEEVNIYKVKVKVNMDLYNALS